MAPIPPLHAREILESITSRATTILHSLEQHLPLQHRDASPSLNALPQLEALPSSILPTRTIAGHISYLLHARQNSAQSSIIPTTYGAINTSEAPGTIAGIVLGSVAGFLLLLYLFYTCLNVGSSNSSDVTESVVRRPKSRSTRTRSRRASETVEIRRDRTPVRIVREPERAERIVVEERVSREVPRRERSRAESDEVIVIEEHSPPRRKKSNRGERRVRRESVVVEEERRDSGYRTVDPLAYGGTVGGGKRGSGSRR